MLWPTFMVQATTSPPDPAGGGAGILPPSFALPSGTGRVLTFSNVSGTVHYNPSVSNDADGNGGQPPLVCCFIRRHFGHQTRSGLRLTLRACSSTTRSLRTPPRPRSTLRMAQAWAVVSRPWRQCYGRRFYRRWPNRYHGGAIQQFIVPDGATRLFLGFGDAASQGSEPGFYADNSGGLNVTFTVVCRAPSQQFESAQLIYAGLHRRTSSTRFISAPF